jgi:hypothetical protein
MRVSWPRWGDQKQRQLNQLLPRPGPLWLATALLALLLLALRRLIHPGPDPPPTPNAALSPQSDTALDSRPAEPHQGRERIALLLAAISTIAALIGATAALLTAIGPHQETQPTPRVVPNGDCVKSPGVRLDQDPRNPAFALEFAVSSKPPDLTASSITGRLVGAHPRTHSGGSAGAKDKPCRPNVAFAAHSTTHPTRWPRQNSAHLAVPEILIIRHARAMLGRAARATPL